MEMTLRTREGIAAIDARLSYFCDRKTDFVGTVVPHIAQAFHLRSSISPAWHEDRQTTGGGSTAAAYRGPTAAANEDPTAVADRGPTAAANRGSTAVLAAEFGAEREAPGQARRMLVAALRRGGCDERLIQDAALVLTELAANAVLHACSPFSVSVSSGDSTLRIVVGDSRPLDSVRAGRELIPRPGRGLGLIDAVSACWGTSGASGGKVVWAELRL
jgi:anti-sigma regulatory factor (Ser/Thr protein kinase)